MGRTVVVTGAASGMGKATAEHYRSVGNNVIGVDVRDAEVIADLGTAAGRDFMIREIARLAPNGVDTVIAAAGITGFGQPATTLSVNFFGVIATLEGCRPLMLESANPCAVAVISAALMPEVMSIDFDLVEACLSKTEEECCAIAEERGEGTYGSGKNALARWIRRASISPEWAGSGIMLNAIAPGTVYTPMVNEILATEAGRAEMRQLTPIAVKAYAEADDIAEVLAFLGDMKGRYVVGQILFVDGGTDAIKRQQLV